MSTEATAVPTPAELAAKAAEAAKTPAPAKPASPEFTPEQHAFINSLIKKEKEAQQAKAAAAAKTDAEKLEELQRAIAEQGQIALNAVLERELSNTHNPTLLANLVKAQNPDLSAKDPAAVAEAVKTFLAANTWAEKTAATTTKPPVVPNPGAGANGAGSAGLLSEDQLKDFDVEKFATDAKYRELVLSSRKALSS